MHHLIYKCSLEEKSVNQDPIELNIHVNNKMNSSNRLKRLMPVLSTYKRILDNPRERVKFPTRVIDLLTLISSKKYIIQDLNRKEPAETSEIYSFIETN